MKAVFTLLSLMLCASPALADARDPTPEENAALKAHSAGVVAHEPGADGVFAVQDDGSLKHVQSGMVCAPRYANMELQRVEVLSAADAKGGNAGCDYGRGGAATLSVLAVKQPDGLTLDKAFADERAKIVGAYPDAATAGPALEIKLGDSDKDTYGPFSEFRSEEFVRTDNGQTRTEDLIVMIHKGWILEIRKSFQGKPKEVAFDEKSDRKELNNAMLDRTMNIRVMMVSGMTLGQ
jgi:hypothetical protein